MGDDIISCIECQVFRRHFLFVIGGIVPIERSPHDGGYAMMTIPEAAWIHA